MVVAQVQRSRTFLRLASGSIGGLPVEEKEDLKKFENYWRERLREEEVERACKLYGQGDVADAAYVLQDLVHHLAIGDRFLIHDGFRVTYNHILRNYIEAAPEDLRQELERYWR